MNKIEFVRTSNPFLNTGIISLDYYLDRYKSSQDLSNEELSFNLYEDKLVVNSSRLFEILENIYILMGKEIYDTSGKKAILEADKYYFIKEPFKAEPFAKMKTYGFAELITNDPTAIAGKNGEKIKFEKLIKEDETFALKIASFLNSKGKKLKFFTFDEDNLKENIFLPNGKRKENLGGESEIFINSGYTKTPEFEFNDTYFALGENTCYLTGVNRKILFDITNSTPFANLSNFSSFREKTNDKKICWESAYIMKFSPKFTLYTYINGLDKLHCYILNTSNLRSLRNYLRDYSSFFKTQQELIENSYLSNFKVHSFKNSKKDSEIDKNQINEFIEQNEILFMLIYTIYLRIGRNSENKSNSDMLIDFLKSEDGNLALTSIYGDRNLVGNTLRVVSCENFNNFKFIIRLIIHLEKNELNLSHFLDSLKFLKNKYGNRDFGDKMRLERLRRNKILGNILKQKSTLSEIMGIFYDCYIYNCSGEYIGFKNYSVLIDFLRLYEPIINKSMTKEEFKNLQEKSINLGQRIGMGIISFADDGKVDKISNAKNARKYIIGLNKARTATQFRDAIIRFQNSKFLIHTDNKLIDDLNEDTFDFIRQYAVISALNIINSTIKPKKEDKNEN